MLNFQAISYGQIYSDTATTIKFSTRADDGVVIYLNNVLVHSAWTATGAASLTTTTAISLPAGFSPITLRFFDVGTTGFLDFSFSLGGKNYTSDGFGVFYGLFD
jgi:hypothetical protein